MPQNFQIVIPNKLYRSGRISPSEISMLVGHLWNVRKIVSLDAAAGEAIRRYIPNNIEHIMMPIDLGGNPTSQARNLSQAIKNGLLQSKNGAVLVHCAAGQDRTGLAIALFRAIKEKKSCEEIFREAKSKNYGAGISPDIKKHFDIEICRHCSGDYCKKFIVNDSGVEIGSDIQNAEDVVSNMRDNIAHQQGSLSAGAIPPAFNPQQSFSVPMNPTENMYLGQFASDKQLNSKIRKFLLKKIIEHIENDEDDNFIVDVGLIDNYHGVSNLQSGGVSGSSGSPNAAGFVDSGTLTQL